MGFWNTFLGVLAANAVTSGPSQYERDLKEYNKAKDGLTDSITSAEKTLYEFNNPSLESLKKDREFYISCIDISKKLIKSEDCESNIKEYKLQLEKEEQQLRDLNLKINQFS